MGELRVHGPDLIQDSLDAAGDLSADLEGPSTRGRRRSNVIIRNAEFFVLLLAEAGDLLAGSGGIVGVLCDRRALRLDLCEHSLESNALGFHQLVTLEQQVLEFLAGLRMPDLESLLITS